MAMAWGGICAENMVALNLEEDHKTVANLKARGAFTLSVPGTDTLVESDYMGLVSSNKVPDKFARTGLHAVKSSRVDAPVITEYSLTLECKVIEMQEQPYGLRVLGEIVNVLADEKILDDEGKIPFSFPADRATVKQLRQIPPFRKLTGLEVGNERKENRRGQFQ